jgi:hypothetical protein
VMGLRVTEDEVEISEDMQVVHFDFNRFLSL